MFFDGIGAVIAIWAQASRGPRPIPEITFWDWLAQPSGSIFVALLLAIAIGGGARWRQATLARRARERIAGDDPAPEAVEAMGDFGRIGVVDLFRLLGHATRGELRNSAGRALSRLWKLDELVPEEEQAIVTRGQTVTWKARRRYPRALSRPIPMRVEFGLPFLANDDRGMNPANLLWSYRIAGTNRVSQETFGSWTPGPGVGVFAIDPRDFPSNGPHRLVLHLRVRTEGVTSIWERDLPQVPFSFEFDPGLALEALLTMPDESRAEAMGRSVRLASAKPSGEAPAFLALDGGMALRDPPFLEILGPLPSDLAHAILLEIEGAAAPILAGEAIVPASTETPSSRTIPLRPTTALGDLGLGAPGERRARLVLDVDPQIGWADPDIRSVWPGTIATDWVPVTLVRL